MHDNICRIICKSAWGKLIKTYTTKEEDGSYELDALTWTVVHDQLSVTRPEKFNMLPEGEDETNITPYMEYIDN